MYEEYNKIMKKNKPKDSYGLYLLISFVTGGIMGVINQGLIDLFNSVIGFTYSDSCMYSMITVVIIASLCTGLGFFDRMVSFCKAGLIVPTTGFAHAMTSSALDYKKEGFIKGIGGNIFKLTGSILLYGMVSAFFFALIKVIIW